MTVIRYWFVSQPHICPGLTLPLFKEGDGHTYSYTERRFHRIQKKNITLKNYMIHVLKIGRTLRHYMLPCQTANQHFCTFLKRVGVVVGVMVGVMVGVKGPATLCILYFVYSAGHNISMQCWSSLIVLPTFTNSRQFLECITFIIPQQIFR